MLPKIDPGILGSVKHDAQNQMEVDSRGWVKYMSNRIRIHDPIMFELMYSAGNKYGIEALQQMLLVYRLIESQVEADELKEMFNAT